MSPAAERVMARADALAAISETPDALTRVYLSAQHLQANQLVGQWMSQAGMTVWQDSVGNICGRYEGAQEGAQAVLLGSHLDTVRNAGATTVCSGCSPRLKWWTACTSRACTWRRPLRLSVFAMKRAPVSALRC
jgi:acetylornithine deacetylase/succinyl-diaminopimelate desuccinylase-like protein